MSVRRQLVAGTRGSALALWQTRHVCDRLAASLGESAGAVAPAIVERIIETRGDRDLRERLQGQLEKGFFTEELESALREGAIDLAVHSLKDLPTKDAPGLVVAAVLPRESPCDWLLARPDAVAAPPAVRGDGSGEGSANDGLPLRMGARVGTSSLRRQSLLARYAPGCVALPLRGNVPTRVERLREGRFDAIVLAAAGVRRLEIDLSGLRRFELDVRRWPTAPGQGAVAVQCRSDDTELRAWLAALDDATSAHAAHRERQWLAVLEGGCTTPFGCHLAGARVYLGLDVRGRWRAAVLEDGAYPSAEAMHAALAALGDPDASPDELATRLGAGAAASPSPLRTHEAHDEPGHDTHHAAIARPL